MNRIEDVMNEMFSEDLKKSGILSCTKPDLVVSGKFNKRRKRIYVAGAISAPTSLEFLSNLAKGIKASVEVLTSGYAVFSPFIDFQLFLALPQDKHISLKDIQDSSMAWVMAADALYVLPGYQKSMGTLAEIEVARSMNIPIFYTLEELKERMPA